MLLKHVTFPSVRVDLFHVLLKASDGKVVSLLLLCLNLFFIRYLALFFLCSDRIDTLSLLQFYLSLFLCAFMSLLKFSSIKGCNVVLLNFISHSGHLFIIGSAMLIVSIALVFVCFFLQIAICEGSCFFFSQAEFYKSLLKQLCRLHVCVSVVCLFIS